VAASVGRYVRVYDIQPNGDLKLSHEIFADTGVDNIDVDAKTGDLYVGSHYRLYTFAFPHAMLGRPKCTFRRSTGASQLVRRANEGGVRDGGVALAAQRRRM